MYLCTFHADGLLLVSHTFSFVIEPLQRAKGYVSITYEHGITLQLLRRH